ncbi:hypothetical protein TWF694_002960 [Orbilia ellipsospora]|uniref:Uncharacterized protein n=1 Tax=Orbilia ellipsospora TaxID=2528407 RepID=A0AAV9X080_9PEZI
MFASAVAAPSGKTHIKTALDPEEDESEQTLAAPTSSNDAQPTGGQTTGEETKQDTNSGDTST